jgi:hypothetical protein
VAELYRLRGHGEKGYVDLILTETHLDLEPSEEWLADLENSLEQGREGAQKAPGVIGWIASKAVNMASNFVKKVLEPHPLAEVEYILAHDRLSLKLGRIQTNLGSLAVDPAEAFIFNAKFREAKAKVTNK